jgi:hypothetical protein
VSSRHYSSPTWPRHKKAIDMDAQQYEVASPHGVVGRTSLRCMLDVSQPSQTQHNHACSRHRRHDDNTFIELFRTDTHKKQKISLQTNKYGRNKLLIL